MKAKMQANLMKVIKPLLPRYFSAMGMGRYLIVVKLTRRPLHYEFMHPILHR
jgi:hypothetical protein